MMSSSFSRDADGKYLALFNGTNIPCTFGNDTVCPASAICMKDIPWFAVSEQCTCEYWFAKIGEECEQIIPDGNGMLVLGLLFIIISVANFFLTLFNLYRIGRRVPKDRATVLLVIVLLAAISLILLGSYWVLRLFTNGSYFVPGTTIKMPTHRLYGTIALPLSFLLPSLALLHVSLTWISVFTSIANARTQDDVSKKTLRRRAAIYHRILFAYYGVFLIAFAYATVVDQLTVVVALSVGAVFFIMISYAFGAWKVWSLLRVMQMKRPERNTEVADVTTSANGTSDPALIANKPPLGVIGRSGSQKEVSDMSLVNPQRAQMTAEKAFVERSLRSIMFTAAAISSLTIAGFCLCISFILVGGELVGNTFENATASLIMYGFMLDASLATFIVGLYGHHVVNNALLGGTLMKARLNERVVGGMQDEETPTVTTPNAIDATTRQTAGPSAFSFGEFREGTY